MTEQDNESRESKEQRKKSLGRRLLKWGLRLAILFLAVGLLGWSAANYYFAKAIRDQVAAIRAAGQPVTFAELDAMVPRADDTQDGGRYYAAAMALVRRFDQALPGYDEAVETGLMDPTTHTGMRSRTEENRLALEMLDRGSVLAGCNYDIGLQYGIAAFLPRLSETRALARAASLRTRLLALEGHGDQAVESAIASLGMLRVFDRQPILVSFLTKVGCMALFTRDIEVVLERGHPSAEALERLDEALAKVQQSVDVGKTIAAERVYFMEVVRNVIGAARRLQQEGPWEPPLPEQMPAHLGGLPGRIMVAQQLPLYDAFLLAAGQGWPGMVDATTALDQDKRRWGSWGSIVAPSFGRAVTISGRTVAMLHSARAAIQIERYRLVNGRLPDSLEQLPGAGGGAEGSVYGEGACVPQV